MSEETTSQNRPRVDNRAKRKALIIAVSEYDKQSGLRQLPFCKNDGEAMYNVLQSQYDIPEKWVMVGRAEGEKIKNKIYEFFRESANKDDTLFFYFSGHGVPDNYGDTFLASSDINKDLIDKYGYNFWELENVAIKKTPARNVIVALDCCLAGSANLVDKNGTEEATKVRGNMEKVFREGNGKCILASSLDGQSSYQMEGQNYSRFTWFLLEGLNGGNGEAVDDNGFVTPYKLSNYIYDNIPLLDQQKPVTKTAMSGDIIIAHYPKLAKRDETSQRDYLLELLFKGKVTEFNRYRKNNPEVKINLLGANLSKLRLNLRGVNLSHADLRSANLIGVDLSYANLEGANLQGAQIRGAPPGKRHRPGLAAAVLNNADLRYANLEGIDLCEVGLNGAILEGARMYAVNLEGAQLTNAKIKGAVLVRSNLRHANLTGSDLDANEAIANGNITDGVIIDDQTG